MLAPTLPPCGLIDLVCIGSIVADFVFTGIEGLPPIGSLVTADRKEIHPGGCATNTSIAFAALGGDVELVARLGLDHLGDEILHAVIERGVRVDRVTRTESETAITIVLVNRIGERTFVYFPGSNSLLSASDALPSVASRTRMVHLADTFLLQNLDGEGALKILREAKVNRKITSMDTSWDPMERWLNLIAPHLSLLDLFFCSANEAEAMTRRSSVFEAAKVLIDLGPQAVIVKMGDHGSLIQTTSASIRVPALNVPVVDTTGAGDCYVAGFLMAHLQGWDYETSARFASAAGAASVGAIGATSGIQSREHVLSVMETRLTKLTS